MEMPGGARETEEEVGGRSEGGYAGGCSTGGGHRGPGQVGS